MQAVSSDPATDTAYAGESASSFPNPKFHQQPIVPSSVISSGMELRIKPQQYIMHAYNLGFSTMAILEDLERANFEVVSLEDLEATFIKVGPVERHTTYWEQRWAFRFAALNYDSIPSDDDLFHRAHVRGFNLHSVEEVGKMRQNHARVMEVLAEGHSDGNEPRWAEAVKWAEILGYNAHEIDYMSMGPWVRIKSFASSFSKIEEILCSSEKTELGGDIGRKWDNEAAHHYVTSAFLFGVSVKEIRQQLLIHGFKFYQITEKFLEKFLRARGLLPSGPGSIYAHIDHYLETGLPLLQH